MVALARTAMDTMRPYAIQRDVKLKLSGPAQVMLKGDAEEIEIIFNNLISNAIKYNKEGGTVECIITDNQGCIEIAVTDTGIGISAQDIEKIFGDFVRIKNEKTKNITGSGLGLSIVKKLTDNYGGKIEVASVPDQGSTFKVRLPNDKPCS
jgi:signal transduction histidine kinase